MLMKHEKEHISKRYSQKYLKIYEYFINKWQIVICIIYFEIHMCDYTSTLSVDFISKLFTTYNIFMHM